MADKISVNCQAKLSEAITAISAMYRDKKFVVVSLRPARTGRWTKTGYGSRCTSASLK